jgi:DeoR/GlpR family transcriptional regulator of sugar metabolism
MCQSTQFAVIYMSLAKKAFVKRSMAARCFSSRMPGIFSRASKDSAKKDAIAQKAATLIKAGGCIFIDTGTTNLALAKALPADLSITVVTNSPAIAAELLRHPLCEVIMTGGQIQRASGGTVGATAANQIQGLSSIRPLSAAVRWILIWG